MKLTSSETGERLPVQRVGVVETDVFCLFLGKVWKMRSSTRGAISLEAAVPTAASHLPFCEDVDGAKAEDAMPTAPHQGATSALL